VFHKHVKGSVHQLRQPPAWALDAQSLADAKEAGATSVHLHDSETRQTFIEPVTLIEDKGWTFDRGWGRQIGLTVEHWHVEGEDAPVQLGLGLAF
jgi:hypothetical protein